jgi:transposase
VVAEYASEFVLLSWIGFEFVNHKLGVLAFLIRGRRPFEISKLKVASVADEFFLSTEIYQFRKVIRELRAEGHEFVWVQALHVSSFGRYLFPI